MPPESTIAAMSTAPMTNASDVEVPNRLPIMADEESSCEVMLMKMPTRKRMLPTISARRPYCLRTTSMSVEQPLRRRGPAYISPSTKAPRAAPRVNHQAERPKEKASCAVPMVDWPPTRVPRMAPHTIQLPALPPVVKLRASLTLCPERILTASSRLTVSRMPMICTVLYPNQKRQRRLVYFIIL